MPSVLTINRYHNTRAGLIPVPNTGSDWCMAAVQVFAIVTVS